MYLYRTIKQALAILHSYLKALLLQQDSVDHATTNAVYALGLSPLFPKISKEAARITRLVSDTRLTHLLAQYAGVQIMDILTKPGLSHVAEPISAALSQQATLRILHQEGQAQVCFDVQHWPALYMLAAHANALAKPTVGSNPQLHQAIVDILLAPVAQRLEVLGLEDLRFEDLRVPDDISTLDSQALALRSKPSSSVQPTFDRVVMVQCKLDSSASYSSLESASYFAITLQSIDTNLLEYCEHLLNLQPLMLSASVLDLPLPGRALLGTQHLTISALCRLRCGDVLIGSIQTGYQTILSTTPSLSSLELVWGVSGGRTLRGFAALEDQNLVMKGRLTMHQNEQEEQSEADSEAFTPTEEESLPDLAGLDIPVHFEIDTISMPLAQLCALGAGHVMELPIPLAQAPVRLITHGKTIGFAELVAVGEHLGIRIQKMAKIDDSAY